MIKRYCDFCGEEMKQDVGILTKVGYITHNGVKIKVWIKVVVGEGSADLPDVCQSCASSLVREMWTVIPNREEVEQATE